MAGLYIHIPFCESRCIYCGFYSTTSLSLRDNYVDALCQEMQLRASEMTEPLETIYLGGGTPSQLSMEQLKRIFRCIKDTFFGDTSIDNLALPEVREITMECNPDDITPVFCDSLQVLPVNRISMGAQTFNHDRLRFLRRRHTAEDVHLAFDRLRAAGINNISIDLMFGFPDETLQEWKRDLDAAISLHAEHISAYSLMIEEGTPLFRMMEQGMFEELDEEKSRQMYETLIDQLTQAGYEHYEISNFSKPGFRSQHNSSYWHEIPYLGIGAAAHSYNKQIRSWNISDLRQYITSITRGKLPSEYETLDLQTRFNDLITTALRTSDGINLHQLRREYGEAIYQHFIQEANKKIKLGLMRNTSNGCVTSTREGLYISDSLLSDFMLV